MAQSPSVKPQAIASSTKHYRLTFVLTSAQQPPQTITLDVPVAANHAGSAITALASSPTGQQDDSVQQQLQCTNVRETDRGLTAHVSYSSSETSPVNAGGEPVHQRVSFEKNIDIQLGQPVKITNPVHVTTLGSSTKAPTNTPPLPPEISVNAVAM